nr:MAG TPA: portal protein [Caudoviricetes sp.]
MYIVLWYRLELAIARDKGRVVNMDITQIPKSMGITPDKWLHYLSSVGVNFINPYECFAPGTKVLMADATIKNIEDIKIGDRVMGPDGTARNVI